MRMEILTQMSIWILIPIQNHIKKLTSLKVIPLQ